MDMPVKITDWDPAEALTSLDAIEIFLNDAFETGDAAYIGHALAVVTRSKGFELCAGESGIGRDELLHTLTMDGSVSLEATLSVLKAFGFELSGKRAARAA
jgi:probable addiction module antidote protein